MAALGVVYGDIGTSPLYALKEVFDGGHVPVTHDNVLGVLSLIFWTMTVIVSLKYVLLVLRADNNGEGGLIAMLALATTAVKRPAAAAPRADGGGPVRHRGVLRRRRDHAGHLGARRGRGPERGRAGAAALGRRRSTLVVLTLLFAVQRFGTGGIGKAFGPITLVWFVVLVAARAAAHRGQPGGAAGAQPAYALRLLRRAPQHRRSSTLGAVVLCVTGGEALYADMGHFGKLPIRIAWYGAGDAGAGASTTSARARCC